MVSEFGLKSSIS
ncbi:uncharacterized protein CELE_T14B4.20 [Caenorhabditis elegans]|uniref:Uncharacterized protein n=1 Tax=Caenorhabditis elegans TaxID=6239 RepID=A0A2K5ATR6_CAEEL|nr:Uncharacterized protein CELE_T14B4.20 [Caenorhabditis elegans]SPC47304.1 Uncharacterized protein CELE_T14B4.20 [Caenorhabditis elegans]|eukprot:NP_001348717.1 Uncharacterized protein CELE_T14B4.20 [Caenorhabditis elegans]